MTDFTVEIMLAALREQEVSTEKVARAAEQINAALYGNDLSLGELISTLAFTLSDWIIYSMEGSPGPSEQALWHTLQHVTQSYYETKSKMLALALSAEETDRPH